MMQMTFCPFIPRGAREGLFEILDGVSRAVDEFPVDLRCSQMAQYATGEWLFQRVSVELDLLKAYAPEAHTAWAELFVEESHADFYAYSFFMLERERLLSLALPTDAPSRLCFSYEDRTAVMEVIWGVVDVLDCTELGEELATEERDTGRVTLAALVPREFARMRLDEMRDSDSKRYEKALALFVDVDGVLDYVYNWFRLEREVMEQDVASIGKLFQRLLTPRKRK